MEPAMRPQLEPWVAPPETAMELDWAPLTRIDLSKFESLDDRKALANDLKQAISTWGFWSVVNSGIPQELVNRMFSISSAFFNLSVEEKNSVAMDAMRGPVGYKGPLAEQMKTHLLQVDVEYLHIPIFNSQGSSIIPGRDRIHEFINVFKDEIAEFQQLCYDMVLKKLFILCAMVLEVPDDYFIQRHRLEDASDTHIRMLKYLARSQEVDENGEVRFVGHTDIGSITLLFPASISGLQIQSPVDQEWKWVKPDPGSITCNSADILSLLTKGYFKSVIHRVVRPPADQIKLPRFTIGYIGRPTHDVPIVPAPSPLLLREGIISEAEMNGKFESEVVTCQEYMNGRVKHSYHKDETKKERLLERHFPDQRHYCKGSCTKSQGLVLECDPDIGSSGCIITIFSSLPLIESLPSTTSALIQTSPPINFNNYYLLNNVLYRFNQKFTKWLVFVTVFTARNFK
ncbi:Clavaminate synthase-like protein [Gymnopus androsaceus JB14]|uniref:Clavaminate synthase-like protein n=1 Tax=Gymnopus androsaceus JB14 TaxID=1447944 RepID=A0A6A4HW94_9AGAR|nr:Clavaminate synthase-like protein [Gymnopus androsaceus JB14]